MKLREGGYRTPEVEEEVGEIKENNIGMLASSCHSQQHPKEKGTSAYN